MLRMLPINALWHFRGNKNPVVLSHSGCRAMAVNGGMIQVIVLLISIVPTEEDCHASTAEVLLALKEAELPPRKRAKIGKLWGQLNERSLSPVATLDD